MESVLEVSGLCKRYPSFCLENVSFSIGRGEIMGFIGRNGAGKTTTIKSILGLVKADGGSIRYFGKDFYENEREIKERIGYACGSIGYYPRKRLCDLARITKSFYGSFDERTYRRYLDEFGIDDKKRPTELSEGMKVKFNLSLALFHGAELLILDEPTSGLDPISREELLETFITLAERGVTILFSTHIISDLVKCADSVTYIKNGKIVTSAAVGDHIDRYLIAHIAECPSDLLCSRAVGICRDKSGYSILIDKKDADILEGAELSRPTLEEVMIHLEKGSFKQ